MKTQKLSFILCYCFLGVLMACQPKTSETSNNNTATTEPIAAAPSAVSADAGKPYEPSPLPKLGAIMQECNKVEFQLYDYGISFETVDANQVMSYFQYIENKRANEAPCKAGKYDGAAVFKNKKGDIAIAMEINIVPPCNRAFFTIDNEKYTCQFTPTGLKFFEQIINRRQSVIEGAQGQAAPPQGH
ncbi:MAG: hypothetical protein JNM36_10980 [Chitinophagales bacterium]|nr:hypothetical protein [Chitinophagales bacterium]